MPAERESPSAGVAEVGNLSAEAASSSLYNSAGEEPKLHNHSDLDSGNHSAAAAAAEAVVALS